MVAETELSQLATMSMMGLIMVVVAVVIPTRSFIQGFSRVVTPLISMLRTSSSSDSLISVTQIAIKHDEIDAGSKTVKMSSKVKESSSDTPKSMRLLVPRSSMLRTSSSTESSTSAIQSAVKYDEVDDGGKLVKKSSKSQKIIKKFKKPQSSEKFAKAIGLEKRLPKHQSSVYLDTKNSSFC